MTQMHEPGRCAVCDEQRVRMQRYRAAYAWDRLYPWVVVALVVLILGLLGGILR